MADEATTSKKNVYISLHEGFVREGIKYTDKQTGEERSFNRVTLPKGTIIDGKDMGGYEFSPLYVNPSKFRGEHWRDIPLLADREVWLQKSVLDAEGNLVVGEDGRRERDTVKVMPEKIKDALAEARKRYAEEHSREDPDKGKEEREDAGLAQRAQHAREASEAIEQGGADEPPFDRDGR